jgi:hypothetical protein
LYPARPPRNVNNRVRFSRSARTVLFQAVDHDLELSRAADDHRQTYESQFRLEGFYTFSKAVSGGVMEGSTDNALVQDFRNLSLDHARLDNDRKHNFVHIVCLGRELLPSTHRSRDHRRLGVIVHRDASKAVRR